MLFCAIVMIGFGICGAFGIVGALESGVSRFDFMLAFLGLVGLGISALAARGVLSLFRSVAANKKDDVSQ